MKQTLPFILAIIASFFIWSCNKNEPESPQTQVSIDQEEATDRDNCSTAFKINTIPLAAANTNQHNGYFFVIGDVAHDGGAISSCEPSTIQQGVWKSMTFVNGGHYKMYYNFKYPTCATNGTGQSTVSLKCGNFILNRTISAVNGIGSIAFYRKGCELFSE
jgi:hypothetical protein